MDNWIHDAKESAARFWDVNVAKPVRYFLNIYFIIYLTISDAAVR
jgi:hypothetical protein